MGQFVFFVLFIVVLFAGAYSYFTPLPKPTFPIKDVLDEGGFDTLQTINTRKTQDVNITTSGGLTQIHKIVDGMTRQQGELKEMIDSEQQILNSTGKQIADIKKQAEGLSGPDLLKLKGLMDEIQDDQRLLVAHGQALTALNDRIMKGRQLLVEQSSLMNSNNGSQDPSEKVKQDTEDSIQRTQDMIDEERQKAEDQQ